MAADANYNTASSTALAFTINKATITITAANQTVTFGTAATTVTSAGSYTPTGFVNGETASVISGSATYSTTYSATTTAATAGVTITPIVSGLSAINYSFVLANGSITINKANSTITATGTTSFTYTGLGQGPASNTESGSTGSITYSYSGTGSTTYSASATKPTAAGTYQVIATVAADANYNTASSTALAFTINKATITITAANQTVTYGTAATTVTSAGTYNPTGFVNGETAAVISGSVTYSSTYTATITAATAGITITPIVSGLSATNYTFVTANGSISINKANSSITATGTTSFTYTSFSQGPASNSGLGSTGSVTYSYSGTGSTTYSASSTLPTAAGTYQVIATVATDANYNTASSSALAFTINKATLTITAANQTVTYGTAATTVTSTGTYTPTGFVNGETAAVISGSATYSTTYTATTTAATAGVTITPIVTSLVATNYTFSAANGSITINKANSSITATGTTSFTYSGLGQGPASNTESGSTGSITYSYSGTGMTTYSASATKPSAAGTYQVIATVATDANYNTASSTALAFNINKATIIITAANQTVTYGTAATTVTSGGSYIPTGFVNGETASVISGSVTYSTTYTATTTIATSGVTITPILTGLSATNYTFSGATGTITIVSPPPTFPLNVFAYQATSTSATVSFATPLTTNGTITSYTATINTVMGTAPSTTQMTLNQSTGGTLTFTGLTTGSTYSFTVTCTNGITSAASNASNNVTLVSLSAINTFNGNTSTDWNTASNWSAGTVPNSTTLVAIATGKTAIISNGQTAFANNIAMASGAILTNKSGGSLTVAAINSTTAIALTSASLDNEGSISVSTNSGNCISFTGSNNTFTANGSISLNASFGSFAMNAISASTTTISGTGFTMGSPSSGVAFGLFYVGSGANLTINSSVSLSSYFYYTSLYNTQIYLTGVNTICNNYGNIMITPATGQASGSYCYALALNSGNNNMVTFNNYGTYTTTTGYQGIRLGTTGTITSTATEGTDSLKNFGTMNLSLSGNGTPINTTYGVNVAILNSGTMNLGGTNANAMSIFTSGISGVPTNFTAMQSLTNTGIINFNSGAIVSNYVPAIGGTAFTIANNTNGILNFKYSSATTALYYSAGVAKTILTNNGGTISGYNCTIANIDSCFISSTGTIAPSAYNSGIGTITLPNGYSLTGKFAPQINSATAYGQLVCPTLDVTGATLQIAPNYNPSFGDSLTLVKSTTSQTSPFSSTTLPPGWSVNYSKTNFISIKYQGPTIGTFTVASQTYGANSFALTAPTTNSAGAFSYSSSNTSVATISGSTVTIVGAGAAIITATQAANGSYASGSTTAILIVNKATISITAVNQSVIYGSSVSSVTSAGSYTPTGFVNGETAAVISGSATYSTSYTTSSSVGASGIVITPIVTGFSANNYTFSAVNGTITVLSPTANFTWTGVVSSVWSNPANWSNNVVPTTSNGITIPANPANNLILQSDLTVTDINLSGNVNLNGYTLTINGNVTGSGNITGSPTSSLKLTGSSSGTLYFDQTSNNATNTLNNLTINTSGSITLGDSLSVKGTVFPTSGTLTTGGNLTLLSDSNGTARIDQVLGTGTINEDVNFQRYITAKTARKYSFLGSPVSTSIRNGWQQQVYITGSGTGGSVCGTTFGDGILNTDQYNTNGFDATPTNAASMFTYNATPINGSRWVSVSNTDQTNLTPGIGYKINIRGNRNSANVTCNNQLNTYTPAAPEAVTLNVTGPVTQGNVVINLNDTAGQKYTLIANPYPSQISYTAFQSSNTNINNKMWTYSPFGNSNYTTYSAGVIANGATGYDNTHGDYIAVGQAFFVEANKNGNVTFQETHKINGTIPNTKYFGSITNKMIRAGLKTTNNTSLDEIVVRFISQGTTTYNPTWDAVSFNSANQVLTTIKDSKALAISTLPDSTTNDTAQLGVISNSIGTYRLTFSDYENIDSNKSIVLVDKFLNTTQDVRVNQQYDFNVTANTASQGTNRFEIDFINKEVILPVHFVSVNAIENKGVVTIKWKVANEVGIANYSVERSNDATHFTSIAQTNAFGINNYSIVDSTPLGNTIYYIIKAINNDGTTIYSNTTQLTTNHLPLITITVFPNPVQDNLNIYLGTNNTKTYKLRVVTMTGIEAISKEEVTANNSRITIAANNLAAGIYLLELTDAEGNKSMKRFVKE